MVTRKKPLQEYELYFLRVRGFDVSFHSGINYMAVESANTYNDQVLVFSHHPDITFECECFYPENMDGIPFSVIIHGSDDNKNLMISDCSEKDKMGQAKFSKRRGQLYPVHRLPSGVGFLEKVRGQKEWRAYCHIDTDAVSTMVSILRLEVPFFLSLDTVKEKRHRAVRAIGLQTEKPE